MKKNLLLTFFIFCSIFKVFAQKLEQDTDTNRWHYTHLFDIKNTNSSKIYKRILNNYVTQSSTIQSKIENKKVVIRYQFRLGTFKYGRITETFDIKDNRLRWRVSDIVYLKAVTSLSKFKELDKTSDKSIIKKINKLIPQGIQDVENKIVNATLENDDW